MYDFTKNEMEIIKDNLMAFIANFGKPRIKRGDDGRKFLCIQLMIQIYGNSIVTTLII